SSMKNGSIVVALLTLVGGGSAWAQGMVAHAPAAAPRPAVPASSTPTGSDAMTPPPPSSVTNPASVNGVPPTPAPATPGLPSPPTSGALPSQQGLDNQTTNELRPSSSLNATQVLSAQSALAAAGFFRGPIDGNMTA